MRARLTLLVVFLMALAAPSTSYAGHHLWKISQLYSSAGGGVQFVELTTGPSNVTDEPNVGSQTITASGHTFTFATSLTGPANTLLVATSGFQSLAGGVMPDFVLPTTSFFSAGGGTIVYAGIDTWNYGAVPTDGSHALLRDGTTAVNSPTNTAHQVGSVNVAPPAVPALPAVGIAILVAIMLLAGSGLVRGHEARSREHASRQPVA
jgi:hypothetical protein